MQCDMGSKQSIHDLVVSMRQSVGDPDIVVYNNGGPPDSSFETATDEDFMEAYVTQVMGFAWIVREVVPEMKRSEEHTSELQSLMRISYAVFCFKKKKQLKKTTYSHRNYSSR